MIKKKTITKAIGYYISSVSTVVVAGVALSALLAGFLFVYCLPLVVAYLGWGITPFPFSDNLNHAVVIIWFVWVVLVILPSAMALDKWGSEESNEGNERDA